MIFFSQSIIYYNFPRMNVLIRLLSSVHIPKAPYTLCANDNELTKNRRKNFIWLMMSEWSSSTYPLFRRSWCTTNTSVDYKNPNYSWNNFLCFVFAIYLFWIFMWKPINITLIKLAVTTMMTFFWFLYLPSVSTIRSAQFRLSFSTYLFGAKEDMSGKLLPGKVSLIFILFLGVGRTS